MVRLNHPILNNAQLDILCNIRYKGFKTVKLPLLFEVAKGCQGLQLSLIHIYAVRALLLYHLLHEVRSDGQEVNLVGNSFRGLYRGNVRIDENRVCLLYTTRCV